MLSSFGEKKEKVKKRQNFDIFFQKKTKKKSKNDQILKFPSLGVFLRENFLR